MRRYFLLGFMAIIAVNLNAGHSWGLTAEDNLNPPTIVAAFGGCTLRRVAIFSAQAAEVQLYGTGWHVTRDASGNVVLGAKTLSVSGQAGGSRWTSGGPASFPEIKASDIAACLGTTVDKVRHFAQAGADAATYADEESIGFSFILDEAAGGLEVGFHEYKIGKSIYPYAEIVSKQAAELIQIRTNLLLHHQPDLISLMSGSRSGGFAAQNGDGQGYLNFVSDPENGPVWADLTASRTHHDNAQSDFVFGAIGMHRAFGDGLLLGGMVQFDHMDETNGEARIRGTGWMAGPYVVARHVHYPLFFEGRLLYGRTHNKTAPFGSFEERFKTTRVLAQMKVAGDIKREATIWSPFFSATYAMEDMTRYVTSLGSTIPRQKVRLGQVEFGLDVSTTLVVSTGDLTLWGGVSGLWSETSGDGFARSVTPDYEHGRMKVRLGLNHRFTGGQNLTVSGWYDGIGASGFENFGATIGYRHSF